MPIIITSNPYDVLGPGGLENYRGEFATPGDLITAIPIAMNGDYAVVESTGTIWRWEAGAWIDSGEIAFTQTERDQLADLVNNAEVIAGHVNTFADLPNVAVNVGLKYIVDNATGVWGVNRKPAGTYLSTGTIWTSKYNAVDVINSLNSTQTQKALSAAQGKILNESKLSSISGDGVDNSDPLNPVLSFPDIDQVYEKGSTANITDTNGPVNLDNSASSSPSLKIGGSAGFPTANLSSGSLHAHSDGLLYQYDATRSKWLCVSRESLSWTDNGNNDNNYLREGNIISTTSGWPVPFDCTIVQIIANGENNLTKGFELRSNAGGAFASIQAFSLSSGFFNNENLNINVDQGVQLKCFATGVGTPVNDPRVTVYIRKRGV